MRLLLVEDDVMVASGIKLGLCDAGYAVDWVGSAERAEEVLLTETFDAAVIDIGLPKMDGLSLTKSIRKSGVTMPVLILTARDALQDRVQGLDWALMTTWSNRSNCLRCWHVCARCCVDRKPLPALP